MSSSSKTKTTVAPPSWAQGTINNALSSEQGSYKQGSGIFNQMQPSITAALNGTANMAANPAPFIGDAETQLDKTINGDYLTPNSNPYEAAMGKQIADQTAGEYNASYGASGRSHGGMAALLSSQGVGNALNNFYGNIYNQERGIQQQAIGEEPALNAAQYTGANNLISQTQAASMTPEQLAALYGSSVAGTVGPYGTTTSKTTQPFGLSSILGLGLMGMSAIPGLGTAVGGALGLPSATGGMAGLIPGVASSATPINISPTGTANYFAANPFGGI